MASNDNQKLAVLIDADNAQASVIQELLAEVSRYGAARREPRSEPSEAVRSSMKVRNDCAG